MGIKMMEWIAMHVGQTCLPAANNVVLYKWLLGGAVVLMALLGLVVCGMLALQVLQGGGDTVSGKNPPNDSAAPVNESSPAQTAEAAPGDNSGDEKTVSAGEAEGSQADRGKTV